MLHFHRFKDQQGLALFHGIAGLDQQPILLHSEKWPDYEGAQQELRRLRKKLRATADDAVVVTVMANLGFRLAMEEAGIDVVETAVGDRYVLEALERAITSELA